MKRAVWAVGLVALVLATGTQGDVFNMGPGLTSLETVPVGNPNNVGKLSGGVGGGGPERICGAVNYTYNIGKYEVTAGQYTEFLNKVAGVDTYGLYLTDMWSSSYGCKIERFAGSGTTGDPWQYQVDADWANRPVNYVNFWASCRFANWLHNGQPTGAQGTGTTETGAYTLTTDGMNNNTIVRNADWKWAVTSEDEWYKAAFYDPNKLGGAGYWDYPTQSNTAPSNVGSDGYTDPGNHANFENNGYTIGGPYYRTNVGEFEKSASAYGTFDQGGNVWEWNESILYDSSRCLRGTSFLFNDSFMHESYRGSSPPTIGSDYYHFGFRVAQVPEPASMGLLILGSSVLLRRRNS